MHVIVTGSAGKLGREAAVALLRAGHDVTGFELKADFTGAHPTVAVDCTRFGQVMGALGGVDTVRKRPEAVVHLAAIPGPGLVPDHKVFEANTISTYNVFSAAARLGIARVVWASSETLLGLPFRKPPAFAPLDESHPDRPEWSYSLSKQMGETMADSFVRWRGDLSIASLRFANVKAAADYPALIEARADPAGAKFNLWSYVDARDGGEACRLAVEAPLAGHERMIVAAADSTSDISSAELMAKYFPDVPLTRPLVGFESLLSSQRAKKLIGYQPVHGWRQNR
jgi:nucleoside-diphosphate-sugar epimerase